MQIALCKPEKTGRVISIDNESHIHGGKQPVGKFIPAELGVELITSDALLYLKMDSNRYDLIYEDTAHSFEFTKALYELAIDRLEPGGVIISHDAVHPKFKGSVIEGILAAGIQPEVYLVDGDSCGLAIWRKPKIDSVVEVVKERLAIASHTWDVPGGKIVEGAEEAPSPIHIDNPPKRKKRKRKLKPVVPEEETSL